ncbi:hypothetical protein BDAP_001928 [Binucleata daphniae]
MVSAFFSATGLLIYTECNTVIGKKSTMSSISYYIYPKLKTFIDICVSLKCFGVGVLYVIILKEIITSLITYLEQFDKIRKLIPNQKLFLLLLYTIFAPFSFYNELSKLRFASFFGILLIFVILAFNTFNYKNIEHFSVPAYTQKKDYVKNLGEFVYGYTCHQNIFTIQNEMKNKKKLNKIVVLSLLSTLIIYIFFGLINLKTFGCECEPNILKVYMKNNSFASFLILLCYAVMILLSFPFQSVPCRLYTLDLITKHAKNRMYNQVFAVLLLTVTYLLAISDLNVKSMLNYIGGSVSACICFVFGPIFYFKLQKQKMLYKIFAISTILFGFLAIFGFIYSSIEKIAKK